VTEQLTLGLQLQEDTTFANFYVADNRQLVLILQEIARGRGEQFVYLWGEKGVGCTHLLQACCHIANRLRLSPMYLPLDRLDELDPAVFDDLEALHLVCVDGVENIAGRPAWEEAFFHFFNRMREAGKRLIVAGRVPPNELGMALPDLVSRLNWGMVFQINQLTDEQKLEALYLRAKGKGLYLPENVGRFLIKRWPRDMKSLFEALEKLDHASLVAKKKLTVPFVKQALDL
jgi:DnaA family protein